MTSYYGLFIVKKTEGLGDKRYIDFLDILLTAKDDTGSGLTHAEIRAEVDTLMFAGKQREWKHFIQMIFVVTLLNDFLNRILVLSSKKMIQMLNRFYVW